MATAPRTLWRRPAAAALSTLALGLFMACGGSEAGSGEEAGSGTTGEAGELTAAQLEHGVGPVTEMDVGPLDEALAATGLEAFTIKCSACHKMDERYVGPPLRDVTVRRSPAFVMNMMLNPEGMLAQHPEARAMLAQYATPMANQNLGQDEARAILEYLRSEAGNGPGS